MQWIDTLKSTEVIVGLLFTIFGGGWGLIEWFRRRSNANRESIEAVVKKSSADERSRLGRVESELKRQDVAIVNLDRRVTDGFREADERFHGIERRLDSVASKEDVNELKVSNARSESRMETLVKNDSELKGMIHRQGEAFSKLAAAVVEKVAK